MTHSSRRPAVSVLILNFNGLEDTRGCLHSLIADGCPDKEIIVLDNGSHRDEAAILRTQFGEQVRIERSDVNMGYAGGNNHAVRLARAERVVFLNNDTEVTPGWLDPLMQAMDAEPDIVACQPKIRSLDDRARFDYAGACGGYIDSLGYPFLRGRVFGNIERDAGQYDTPADIDWASGACMLMRRNEFSAVGGFDERLFAYMEEVDLSWRLRAAGMRIRSVPSSLVYHRGNRAWRDMPRRKRFHEHRNNLVILLKNLPAPSLMRVIPLRLALEWIAAARYLLRGEISDAVAAVQSFFSFLVLAPGIVYARDAQAPTVGTMRECVLTAYFLRRQQTFDSIVSQPIGGTSTTSVAALQANAIRAAAPSAFARPGRRRAPVTAKNASGKINGSENLKSCVEVVGCSPL